MKKGNTKSIEVISNKLSTHKHWKINKLSPHVLSWCYKNCKSGFTFFEGEETIKMIFFSEEEAILFKLRWC